VVDIHAGKKFRNWSVGYCPCLTAARGRSKGFYITNLARSLDNTDMCILQGMRPSRLVWKDIIPEGSFGHMIGNSMSVNILERLLPKVLHAAGLIEALPKDPPAKQQDTIPPFVSCCGDPLL